MSEEKNQDKIMEQMGMGGDFMINLLFQAQAATTINSPIIMNKVTGDLRNIKNSVITGGTDSVFDTVFEEFKADEKLIGTVHYEPNFWRSIFGKAFIGTKKINDFIRMKQGDDSIIIDDYQYVVMVPNGCCTNDSCPVKKFYEIYNSQLLQVQEKEEEPVQVQELTQESV